MIEVLKPHDVEIVSMKTVGCLWSAVRWSRLGTRKGFGVARCDALVRPSDGFVCLGYGFAWVRFGFVFGASSFVFSRLVASFLDF